MPRTGAKHVKVSFTAGQLTHFGGVYLLHRFLQRLQLRTFLHQQLHISERNNFFSVTERLLALMYPMILGLNSIELTTLLGTNGVFQYLTGLPRFPSPNTLRGFLVGKADVLRPRLHTAHNLLRSHFLVLPRVRSSYWFDFDSTAKTLYGNQEGVVKGYNPGHKGKKSYHPSICTEAHLSDCAGGELRYGNAHTAEGILDVFDEAISLLPSGVREVRVRADSGFYNKDFIARLSKNDVKFAVVARMTSVLENKMPGLRYHRINKTESTAEFQYQPQGWDKPYRFVVLREKLTEERKEQLTLFTVDKYAYHSPR